LQEFLSLWRWDEAAVRDRLQRRVARRHGHPHSVGIIDETRVHKQGDKTACVQRQSCGSRGKMGHCVVAVHLGYAAGDFHTLLDGDLFLPEKTWHRNRTRCRAAGIPDDVVYRPKWQIALEPIQRALANGVRFAWLTFDEGYGGKPPFFRGLEGLGQNYVGEIPADFRVWTKCPEVRYREPAGDRLSGRPRQFPRLKVRNTPACEVRNVLAHSPKLRRVPWTRDRVKDGDKGPMVWEAKRLPVWIKDEDGLPVGPYHLLIARNVLKPDEVQFFLSNAPPSAPVETLLLVAFSRWRVERLFEDSKDELGMDHFEVRQYGSIPRHLILTCVSPLFLAEFRLDHGGKKASPEPRPTAKRDPDPQGPVVAPRPRGRPVLAPARRIDRRATDVNPTTQRSRPPRPWKTNRAAFTGHRSVSGQPTHVPMTQKIAL
jgi:SRSO17 transposase